MNLKLLNFRGFNLYWIYNWSSSIIIIVISLLILVAIYVFYSTENPKDKNVINTDIKVFRTVDSLSAKFASDQILNHNNLVISTLQERESTAYNLRMSRESDIKQSRTIYIAILVVLLSLLFNMKNITIDLNIKLLLIITIFVSYLVEVHSYDLLQRQDNCVEIIARSTEEIINSYSLNSTWFTLDYNKYLRQIDEASKGSFIRKLIRATHPDIEQIGIYILPFVIIFGLFFKGNLKMLKANYILRSRY
jgi:hypothetical protein